MNRLLGAELEIDVLKIPAMYFFRNSGFNLIEKDVDVTVWFKIGYYSEVVGNPFYEHLRFVITGEDLDNKIIE